MWNVLEHFADFYINIELFQLRIGLNKLNIHLIWDVNLHLEISSFLYSCIVDLYFFTFICLYPLYNAQRGPEVVKNIIVYFYICRQYHRWQKTAGKISHWACGKDGVKWRRYMYCLKKINIKCVIIHLNYYKKGWYFRPLRWIYLPKTYHIDINKQLH